MQLAIPNLGYYRSAPVGGINRVMSSLITRLADFELTEARVVHPKIPLIRNFLGHLQLAPATDVLLWPQLTGAYVLKKCQVPSVVIVYDIGIVDCPEDRRDMNGLSIASVRRSFYSLRNATQIIAISQFTAERLIAYLPDLADRVTVVSLGADVALDSNAESKEDARVRLQEIIGDSLGDPLLLYVGTERTRKNIPLLLEVLRELKAEYPGIQLMKVGDAGGERFRISTLKKMAEIGLSKRDVLFTSSLSDAELQSAYRAADIYVSASQYEGFCLPVAEALARGTPVVAVAAGAVPEVVGTLGTLVDSNAKEFANAVREQIETPLRIDAQERTRFAETFTWDIAASQLAKVLRRAVE